MSGRPLSRSELVALLDHFAGSPYAGRLEQIAAHDAAQREIIATQAREIARLAAPSQAYLDDEEERGYAVPSPPWGTPAHAPDEVREAAERLRVAEALLLDVWDSHHREGWEQSETFESVMDRLGDWRWNNGHDQCNPPLRPDPRKALPALTGNGGKP